MYLVQRYLVERAWTFNLSASWYFFKPSRVADQAIRFAHQHRSRAVSASLALV
jgi:hypothetical protein